MSHLEGGQQEAAQRLHLDLGHALTEAGSGASWGVRDELLPWKGMYW